MGSNCFESFKSSLFQVNRPLLKLKICYFVVYAIWFVVFPYVALISAQVIEFNQLSIIYACIPATSIFGPILTGFIADKIGNYNIILTCTLLLNVVASLPVLWLGTEHRNYQMSLNQTNCSNDSVSNSTFPGCDDVPQRNSYVFPILIVARLIGFYSFDATNSILDACCLTMTRKYKGDFARQKMFATISMIVVPFAIGALVDEISEHKGYMDYSLAFYISTGLTLTISLLIYQLDVEVDKNKQSFVKTAKKIVGRIDVDAFLLSQIVVGVCTGWHRSFFPVYVDVELRNSNTLYGAATSIGGVGSLILFWTAKIIIEKFGSPTTVAASLIVTCIRFFFFFYLSNPWIVLINESFEGTSGLLALLAGNYFSGVAAPPGMLASFNGILFAAIFGAGRGTGLTVGSILASAYGIRFTYLTFSILAGSTSLTYIVSYHLFWKKIEHSRLAQASHITKPSEELSEPSVENVAGTPTNNTQHLEIILTN